ncbi:hypothetical protein KIN20_001790 [Parelaphostrongylus tenuis]|uniref:Uncharacterized protein n=1 Tax=Parelaphostrongylus tenuis TaxID=148309 RepID=A0AAD5LXH2_PARTN|nr:hypothetical protein KIN20_001790 [Parelaphostrongylus tenuis]
MVYKVSHGDTDLANQPKSVKRRENDRKSIFELIEEDSALSTGDYNDDFQRSDEQIRNILKDSGKKWRKSDWISHDLLQAQKNK